MPPGTVLISIFEKNREIPHYKSVCSKGYYLGYLSLNFSCLLVANNLCSICVSLYSVAVSIISVVKEDRINLQ